MSSKGNQAKRPPRDTMYYPPKTPTLVDLARAGLIWPGSMHEEMKRPAHPKVLQRLAR